MVHSGGVISIEFDRGRILLISVAILAFTSTRADSSVIARSVADVKSQLKHQSNKGLILGQTRNDQDEIRIERNHLRRDFGTFQMVIFGQINRAVEGGWERGTFQLQRCPVRPVSAGSGKCGAVHWP